MAALPRARTVLSCVVLVPAFLFGLGFCLVVDVVTVPLQRPWWIAALLVTSAALLLFLASKPAPWWELRAVCVGTAVILLVPLVPWHPRKRFAADVWSLGPGMTVDEVEDVMGGYMKGAGAKWQLPPGQSYEPPDYPHGAERATASGTMVYRWSNSGSYDADWGEVTFVGGRVTRVRFLPD